ncbi:MAG: zf-TFIIB domain-containing protein [Gemmatimonadales bacterium]
MTDKPSRNEDEYFAKQEREILEKQRDTARKAAIAAERKSHYMKCPKCGADLVTEDLHKVQIDRCPECHGLWLDAGEIDAAISHENKGMLGRFFGDFVASFRDKDTGGKEAK